MRFYSKNSRKMVDERRAIGIDLGTTSCASARTKNDDKLSLFVFFSNSVLVIVEAEQLK